jgi:hypothetical protein
MQKFFIDSTNYLLCFQELHFMEMQIQTDHLLIRGKIAR